MAKASGKGGSIKREQTSRYRSSPTRTPLYEDRDESKEVSARRAFLTSFVMFSIILAPVLGIGLYFARNIEFVLEVFPSREDAYLGGMAMGLVIAFVVSIIFTRKAVA